MKLSSDKYTSRMVSALARKHIHTDDDVRKIIPLHYRDYRQVLPYSTCTQGIYQATCGVIESVQMKFTADHSRRYVSVCLNDPSCGFQKLYVMFYGQPSRLSQLSPMVGRWFVACGKVAKMGPHTFISNPDIFVEAEQFCPFIRTVYSSMKGVSDKNLRTIIGKELSCSGEILDPEVLTRFGIPGYPTALYGLHYPKTERDIILGKKRLLFNDLLYFSMGLIYESEALPEQSSITFTKDEDTKQMIASLPYTLTKDQQAAIDHIRKNSIEGKRNDILLQGDVGSGKTIVAAASMMLACENGYQAIMIAPREVLAKQHYDLVSSLFEPYGYHVVYLRSGMKTKERRVALEQIADGTAQVIIGTHSCLSEEVIYPNLGLVVADEEHLFGVAQKEQLAKQAKNAVHRLSMSATPIPRSMFSVLYGSGKEACSIKTKPAGRLPIITQRFRESADVRSLMMEELQKGHKCYIVCPSIDSDEMASVRDKERTYQNFLSGTPYQMGLVNGKMKKQEMDKVVSSFKNGEIQVLLSTTVIEVGVDVKEATVIVIEDAERFGLASLHQLRGRVGRSSLQSYCCLVSDDYENPRLTAMENTNDGFVIAEQDLLLRGTGNLLGTEQSGQNKYVDAMLSHPQLHDFAMQAARFCVENGYGKELLRVYKEHEELDAS